MSLTCAVGDIHGKWDTLQYKITNRDINNCTLISVGDIGVGFLGEEKQKQQFNHLNDFFKSRNIVFIGIRGNHDDPKYFGKVDYSNFKLVKDYTLLNVNDKNILLVGGAISVDRKLRKEGESWWSDEKFVLDPTLIQRCDILITHSAPSWVDYTRSLFIEKLIDEDVGLREELMEERKNIDILLKLSRAKHHYCGHFHTSKSVDFEGVRSYTLDENELYEI